LKKLVIENLPQPVNSRASVQDLLDRAFQEANSEIASCKEIYSGTTAVVAMYQEKHSHYPARLYIANVGDARAVMSHHGKAVRLSYDHKATDEKEVARINQAGGIVHNERVNGVLAITRAIGDEELKDLIISRPYTSKIDFHAQENDLLVLACDGLWDVCSDQEAIDLIQECKNDPVHASELLVDYAIENGSADNITVMVVYFQ
jgi:protein phosphatase PTC1